MTASTSGLAGDPFFSTTSCETSGEFIAALSRRSAAYPSAFPRAWVFRGHSDDAFPLVPTALRNESRALSDLTLFSIKTNLDQAFNEREVLKQFLEVSDSIGLTIPEDTQTLRRWLDLPARKIKEWPPNEVLSLMALANIMEFQPVYSIGRDILLKLLGLQLVKHQNQDRRMDCFQFGHFQ
jgi:hypothetical protein